MSRPVMIMAGGTGGHVIPALAIANLLRARREIVWLGTERGIEARLVPAAGYPVEWIEVEGLRGKGLARWLKAPGERVTKLEPLLEISTDKIDTELPAPDSGILLEILVPEGKTVGVGTVLARIGESSAEYGVRSAEWARCAHCALQIYRYRNNAWLTCPSVKMWRHR